MILWGRARYALGMAATAAFLAACGGSQPLIGAPGAMPQSRALTERGDRIGSWMLPEAKSDDLLYVTHEYGTDVSVYSYPKGALVGTLSNAYNAQSDCADKAGNVFIVNFDTPSQQPGSVVEYAHGGTRPIRTLTYPGAFFSGCAVDPTTGNLAVTEYIQEKGRGGILIYEGARGAPSKITDRRMADFAYCAFDNDGNLYVDGVRLPYGGFQLAELPRAKKSLVEISLGKRLDGQLAPGGVQWDGSSLVIGNARTAYHGVVHIRVYRIRVAGSTGKVSGKTLLKRAHSYRDFQFWIQGGTIISPYGGLHGDPGDTKLGFWTYPEGGLTSFIRDTEGPWGVTVSLASHR